MKNIGAGIAIAGIWIGVGLVGLHDTQGWSGVVVIMAVLATVFALGLRE